MTLIRNRNYWNKSILYRKIVTLILKIIRNFVEIILLIFYNIYNLGCFISQGNVGKLQWSVKCYEKRKFRKRKFRKKKFRKRVFKIKKRFSNTKIIVYFVMYLSACSVFSFGIL